MSQYSVNTLLKCQKEDRIERILWFDQIHVYVININQNNLPYLKYRKDINDAIDSNSAIVLYDDSVANIIKEEDIPQKHKEIRNKSWNMIKTMVSKEPYIYESKYRRQQIKIIAKEYKVSELSLMNYLKKYWKRGKVPNALLPDYFNCGARGKERSYSKYKRGRPRKYSDISGEGINITEDIKKIFTIAINRFYYATAKNSLILTYELMRKEYFADGYKVINGVKVPKIKTQSDIPTFGQFRYWFQKQRNIKKEITTRYSNKKFQKEYRAITGNAGEGVTQPGTYEIDCQIGDVYLVSRYNRNWVIGRPAIYAIVDKFSRMICGIYVGLEKGSYAGAMMALLNASTNKVQFCKQYGIDIKQEDWPAHYLPEKIIGDRGELEGTRINQLINVLNIKVSIEPPYRADLKSIVERTFQKIGDYIKPHIPGVVDLDGRERGDKDYRLGAKLDIYQFYQIMIKSVLYHDNYHILNYYKREEMMIADDVKCISRDIFNWGIKNKGGSLRIVSDELVKLALMPTAEVSSTAKGIRFKDMYYISKEMLQNQTFVNARQKSWKVKINYDPRNLDYIYVHGDTQNDYQKCFLIDSNSRYKDKTMEEIQLLLIMEKRQKEELKDVDSQAKTHLISDIENIVQEAKKQYDQELYSSQSDKKRIENIRENRRVEKIANRQEETFELEREINIDDNTVGIDESHIEHFDLLLKKQEEGINNG